MSQKILAIDLGTYSLKMSLLERHFDDFQLLSFTEHLLNHQARVTHEEQIHMALDQVLQEEEFTDIEEIDLVCSSMPGHQISHRILEFPFSSRKNIQEALDFQLEDFVPFPIEDVFSDFHILDSSTDQTQVFVSYGPTAKISSYLETLKEKNIDPKYFGSDLMDLSNLSHASMLPKEGFYVICDLGHSKTNICIMEGSRLRYARTLGVGGIHFTKAIQRAYNLNFEKAESLKLSRGRIYVHEGESDQVSRVLTHVSEELVTLIKQTIMAFQKTVGQIPITAIYCCGGAANLAGLLDYMSFHLKTNVLELNPMHMISHKISDPDAVGMKVAPSLALALRAIFSNKAPRINFRKGPFAYKQDLQMITSEFKSVGVFLLLILALGIGYYFYADHYYQQKIVAINHQVQTWVEKGDLDLEVSSSRGNLASKNFVKKYLRVARNKVNEVNSQLEGFSNNASLGVLEVMQEVSEKLPPKSEVNFQVSEMNYTGDFVRLTAQTDDPLNATKIVAALSESEHFQNVEADDPKPKPGNIWDFTLKLDLKKTMEEVEDDS